ncbi:hypothetical protein BN1221_00357c [Brenneria goodwinii]|uniref:Uncharacterized protein n=1 Tax=Brenneria goodwinii TaxID=1109412 RepID=A0A0G4JPY9_9GAMM|nr:hypothetical protein BN1221_00357c [Brenneria goodwinii]
MPVILQQKLYSQPALGHHKRRRRLCGWRIGIYTRNNSGCSMTGIYPYFDVHWVYHSQAAF